MRTSSPALLARENKKGKEKEKEKESEDDIAHATFLDKDADKFYPFGHQQKLKSYFLVVAKALFLHTSKYTDSIRIAKKYVGLVEELAIKLSQDSTQPMEFQSLFIQRACHLIANNVHLNLDTILTHTELSVFLWLSRSGLSMEDGLSLVVRGQRAIDLEEWKQDKVNCIERISDLKKFLQVKPTIEEAILNELKRINHSRLSFLMSKADTENKINALISAWQAIHAADNLNDLCAAIYTFLLTNPNICGARNKLKFIFTEQGKQTSQTKIDLMNIIRQYGLEDKINAIGQASQERQTI